MLTEFKIFQGFTHLQVRLFILLAALSLVDYTFYSILLQSAEFHRFHRLQNNKYEKDAVSAYMHVYRCIKKKRNG